MLQPSPAFMSRARPLAVARWLWAVAALLLVMIVVGGITRLTESGLSITEWKPITGTLPPLSEAAWQAEFDAYKQIPEYQQINSGMTLAGFKQIYFWEYVHRLLGRVIGLAFAVPLLWFAVRKRIPAGYGWRLVALLALGALQGTIGWWMVASGLTERTDVSHLRLTVHLLVALVILGGIVWTALDLRALHRQPLAQIQPAPSRLTPVAGVALILLFAQLGFGALTAGLNAGHAATTWPLMGETLFPSDALPAGAGAGELVNNPFVVQFVHRWLAFVAAAGLLVLAWRAGQLGWAVAALLMTQIALGIATLLTGVHLHVAVAHQLNAALLLIAVVMAAHRSGMSLPVTKPA